MAWLRRSVVHDYPFEKGLLIGLWRYRVRRSDIVTP